MIRFYVFEAPIDLLSFISLYQKDWQEHSYVALCGVAEHALMQLLSDAPHVQQVALCLDNDKAGIQARERIKQSLSERGYQDVFPLFSRLKDWNEDLQAMAKTSSGTGGRTRDEHADAMKGGMGWKHRILFCLSASGLGCSR